MWDACVMGFLLGVYNSTGSAVTVVIYFPMHIPRSDDGENPPRQERTQYIMRGGKKQTRNMNQAGRRTPNARFSPPSPIFTDFHRFSPIFTDLYGFSPLFTDLHGFSSSLGRFLRAADRCEAGGCTSRAKTHFSQ